MSWKYRVGKQTSEGITVFGIIEQFRIEGKNLYTNDFMTPISDSKKDLIECLEMMLKDAKSQSIHTMEAK